MANRITNSTRSDSSLDLLAKTDLAGHKVGAPLIERRRGLSLSPLQKRDDSPMGRRTITVDSPTHPSASGAHALYVKQNNQIVPLSPNSFHALTGKRFTSRLIQSSIDKPDSPFAHREPLFAPLEEFVFSLWNRGQNQALLYLEQTAGGSFAVRAKDPIPEGTLLCELSGVVQRTRILKEGFEHISTKEFAGIGSFVSLGFPNCTIASCFSADRVEHFFLITSERIEKDQLLCCNWGHSLEDTLKHSHQEPRSDEMYAYFRTMDIRNHAGELLSSFQEGGTNTNANRLVRGQELFRRQSALSKLHYLFSQPVALFFLLCRLEESRSLRRDSSPSNPSLCAKRIFERLSDRSFLALLSISGNPIQKKVLAIAVFFNTMSMLPETSPKITKQLVRFCKEATTEYPIEAVFTLLTEISEVCQNMSTPYRLPAAFQDWSEKAIRALTSDDWDALQPLLRESLSKTTPFLPLSEASSPVTVMSDFSSCDL